MTRFRNPRFGAALMSVLTLLYIVVIGQQAVILLGTGDFVAVAMGVALLVLPALGIWGIAVELIFGIRAERLSVLLAERGRVPEVQLPQTPSGRIDRQAANAVFETFAEEIRAEEDDWTAWFRLALVYDACGDRRRARGATRQAIVRERAARAIASR